MTMPPMESFFHTLKTALVYQRHYATRAEATRDIFAYIEDRHRLYQPDRDGAKSSLTLSIFSGEDHLLRTKLDPRGAPLRNSSVSLIVSRIGGITSALKHVESRKVLGKIVVGLRTRPQFRDVTKALGQAAVGALTIGILRTARHFDPTKTANLFGRIARS